MVGDLELKTWSKCVNHCIIFWKTNGYNQRVNIWRADSGCNYTYMHWKISIYRHWKNIEITDCIQNMQLICIKDYRTVNSSACFSHGRRWHTTLYHFDDDRLRAVVEWGDFFFGLELTFPCCVQYHVHQYTTRWLILGLQACFPDFAGKWIFLPYFAGHFFGILVFFGIFGIRKIAYRRIFLNFYIYLCRYTESALIHLPNFV